MPITLFSFKTWRGACPNAPQLATPLVTWYKILPRPLSGGRARRTFRRTARCYVRLITSDGHTTDIPRTFTGPIDGHRTQNRTVIWRTVPSCECYITNTIISSVDIYSAFAPYNTVRAAAGFTLPDPGTVLRPTAQHTWRWDVRAAGKQCIKTFNFHPATSVEQEGARPRGLGDTACYRCG